MLKVENIIKKYPCKEAKGKKGCNNALMNVSMEFEQNRIYALVGESGSGKSTLARILSCIEKPTSGTVILEGKSISEYSRGELRQKRTVIQLVMQDAESSMDPRLTVSQLLSEPLKHLLGLPREERHKRIDKLLQMVGLPREVLGRLPRELSGGQQKRVCIARALSVEPKLIIFDESFSGLDVTLRKRTLDLLKELKKQVSCGYLIITHDLDIAMYMADHIFVMKSGELVESIAKPSSYGDFKSPYANELVSALMIKQCALQ